MKPLTKTQRIIRALDRAEYAAMELLAHAEALKDKPVCIGWRRDLFQAARAYARKMDALTRIRK